jgi:hypothetical protein
LTDCDKLLVTLDGAQYQVKDLLMVKLIDCDEDWSVAQLIDQKSMVVQGIISSLIVTNCLATLDGAQDQEKDLQKVKLIDCDEDETRSHDFFVTDCDKLLRHVGWIPMSGKIC